MKHLYLIAIFTLIQTSVAAQKENLILKLETGATYKQVTATKATIHQEVNGKNVTMVMTVRGTMAFLVKSFVKDYEMEAKYENLSLSMELPQGTMEFSSEKKNDQDVFSLILGAMKDKPFEVRMTPSGKVVEIRNIESVWESAFKDFPGLSEAQLAQIKSQLAKAYGTEAFRGNIEMSTAVLPEAPVAKGDTWIIKTKLESGMSADIISNYKYVERNKDFILIKGDSKIETENKDAYIETNGMPLKYDMKGSMVSEVKVDPVTCWIVEAKINQEIAGNAFIKENPQMPSGMKIPIMMVNETVITNN